MIGAAMRIVKVGVLAPTNKGIPLGVQGENSATQVEFDTRPWFREYPSGTVSAVARRYGDPAPYPLNLDVADGTAVWQVSDTDTAKAGEGAVELTMTSGGARVRSLTFKTLVTASLTDSPVDDDAWYGWLDKAVVKVDETVQSAQRKMDDVDLEWTALKADVTEKVDECGEVAAQAASDAHHAKVDAQATAKALESAEGSVAKAEAAANRAVDAALAADDSAVEASRSALSAGESAEAAAGSATTAATSASEAATSASNAATSASSAAVSAEHATAQKVAAENAKDAVESFKAGAEAAKGEAARSATNAASSATAAAKSASDAAASVGAINVIAPKTVDVAASSEVDGSVAVGAGSVAKNANELSIGNDTLTREITHVSTPTAPTSASTKKYTDDNDAKTLTEANQYTDANTSNALVGTVSGKLLHVEDAWPCKPLSLTIDGAYKQDGTPSPENPVPITVVENPVLRMTGADTSASGTSLPITLPAEHPYLAALPDGTHDEIVIDKHGNASLVARVFVLKHDADNSSFGPATESSAPYLSCMLDVYAASIGKNSIISNSYKSSVYTKNSGYVYTPTVKAVVYRDDRFTSKEQAIELLADVITYITQQAITYSLGKLDIPSLHDTISNVWIEADLTPNCSMTYKRDVNVVIADLTAQIAALKGTNDIVHGDSTASPDDAIDILGNDVNAV